MPKRWYVVEKGKSEKDMLKYYETKELAEDVAHKATELSPTLPTGKRTFVVREAEIEEEETGD